MKRITVLLAEDHPIVRVYLGALLKHERDIAVAGEATTGPEAVHLTRELRPAVVVMDVAMPLLNGLQATRQIREDLPDTRVLILSAHNNPADVEQAVRFGAAGYLPKHASPDKLAATIREVVKGRTFFSDFIHDVASLTRYAISAGVIESRVQATGF